jgi:hypothetical protein
VKKKRYYYVYQITNLLNGKIYVGAHSTYNLEDKYMGSGKILLKAIKRYGVENFKKEILVLCNSEIELFKKEAEIVTSDFIKRTDTYNLIEGGRGGSGYTEQQRQQKLKIGFFSEEAQRKAVLATRVVYREKIYEPNKRLRKGIFDPKIQEKGRNAALSESARKKRIETCKKIEHQKGNKNSQYGTMWITDGIANKKIKRGDKIPRGFKKGRIINRM